MKVVCRVLTLGVTADRPGVSMKILNGEYEDFERYNGVPKRNVAQHRARLAPRGPPALRTHRTRPFRSHAVFLAFRSRLRPPRRRPRNRSTFLHHFRWLSSSTIQLPTSGTPRLRWKCSIP